MSKTIAKVWTFGSSSNPTKSYETLQYTDGSMSCNCPGWTRRIAADGSRSCKHTRIVDQGTADSTCSSKADYTQKSAPVAAKATTKAKDSVFSAAPTSRKVLWQ